MIASDRPLVNRLTCPSLGSRYILMWQCRQQEQAKPAIRIKWFSNSIFNVKKIFTYLVTIICWINRFCRRFFPSLSWLLVCYLPQKISSCNILSAKVSLLAVVASHWIWLVGFPPTVRSAVVIICNCVVDVWMWLPTLRESQFRECENKTISFIFLACVW